MDKSRSRGRQDLGFPGVLSLAHRETSQCIKLLKSIAKQDKSGKRSRSPQSCSFLHESQDSDASGRKTTRGGNVCKGEEETPGHLRSSLRAPSRKPNTYYVCVKTFLKPKSQNMKHFWLPIGDGPQSPVFCTELGVMGVCPLLSLATTPLHSEVTLVFRILYRNRY